MDILNQFSYDLTQQRKLAQATIRNYVADVAQFIAWFEHKEKRSFSPQEIHAEDISQYIHAQHLSASSKKRHVSSLKTFFHFLKTEGMIRTNPFEKQQPNGGSAKDTWKVAAFANYLYVYNASELTIKHYLMDVKQYLRWTENKKGNDTSSCRSLEAYVSHLTRQNYSRSTMQRKQVAIKKYLVWGGNKNSNKP